MALLKFIGIVLLIFTSAFGGAVIGAFIGAFYVPLRVIAWMKGEGDQTVSMDDQI